VTDANAALSAYILLDRSGSMASRWEEALGSINAYVEELGEARLTVAVFDSVDGLRFDVIRERVPAPEWKPLTPADAHPRGQTPLLDALGRIAALAEAEGNARTSIVVMTDGAENDSREVSLDAARAIVARAKARGWQVVFLGADFDAFGEAGRVGVARGQTINMKAGDYDMVTRAVARQMRRYRDTSEGVAFDDEDRGEPGGPGPGGEKA